MRLWIRQLTGGLGSKLNPIEARDRVTGTVRLEELRNVNVKQDVQVRAVNVLRSNVGNGRTAALAVADGGRRPSKTNLPHKNESQSKNGPDITMTGIKRTVFPVFISRWKGNSDEKPGSLVAAAILASMGHEYPGRLMGTIPLWLCASGMYWYVWEDV